MAAEQAWSTRTPEGRFEYVVIGSGMGGMACAAMLAKLGKRVLVLEQNREPGGFTHSFTREGWRWDVGLHAVGEVTEHSLPGRLLAHLSEGRLRWAGLGEVYDEFHWPGGARIEFCDKPDAFKRSLYDAFPHESQAIDRWFELAAEVAHSMRPYYLARTLPPGLPGWAANRLLARKAQGHFERRTSEVLAELTDDPKLRAVLVAQWGYYGAVPSRSSFAVQALVTRHFLWGGYYPVGGSREIARTLLGTVAATGGWTKIEADVDQIVLDRDGRAIGVRLLGEDDEPGEFIGADRVISAAGVWSTVNRLLPPTYADEPWVRSISRLRPSPAHVCLYLGFEGDIRAAGAGAGNKWFHEDWTPASEEWEVAPPPEGGPLERAKIPRAPTLYCSFSSLKDPSHDPGPEQRHTGSVVTFVPWQAFERWRRAGRWQQHDPDYEGFKGVLKDALLQQFLEHMPALEPMIRYAELSTPLDTELFARPYAGSIYGLAPTPARYRNPWLRPRSPIPNLFFAGSEVATVGVIGAMMGGVMAAVSAEPVAGLRLLARLDPRLGIG